MSEPTTPTAEAKADFPRSPDHIAYHDDETPGDPSVLSYAQEGEARTSPDLWRTAS